MAKQKPDMSDLFKRTEPEPGEKPKGKRKPVGVYFKRDLHEAMEQIAQENNVTLHALITYAAAEFVKGYRSGKKLQTETKTTLKTDI